MAKTLTQANNDNAALHEALSALEALNSKIHEVDTTKLSPSVIRRIERLKRIGDKEWTATYKAFDFSHVDARS